MTSCHCLTMPPPRDWSILALQNIRTGKAHYLVICTCPETGFLGSHVTTYSVQLYAILAHLTSYASLPSLPFLSSVLPCLTPLLQRVPWPKQELPTPRFPASGCMGCCAWPGAPGGRRTGPRGGRPGCCRCRRWRCCHTSLRCPSTCGTGPGGSEQEKEQQQEQQEGLLTRLCANILQYTRRCPDTSTVVTTSWGLKPLGLNRVHCCTMDSTSGIEPLFCTVQMR